MANKNAQPPDGGFKDHPERINRKGRPKLPDIREALEKVMGEEKDGLTALDAVLMALRKKATSGDVRAAEVLLDRAFGKAIQKNANTDSQGNDRQDTYIIRIEK